MKKWLSVMRLDGLVFMRSGKPILPLLLLVACLGVLYAVIPVDVVGSACISAVALFYIGAALGLSYAWSEDAVFSQTLCVKAGHGAYLCAQSAFMSLCGVLMGAVAAVCPAAAGRLIANFYSREIGLFDVLNTFFLNASLALCGCSLGMLFHPRIVPDRKFAYVLCLLAGLMGMAGRFMGIPAYISWVLPPVYEVIAPFSPCDVFPARDVFWGVLRALLYAVALTGLRIGALARKRY